MQNFKRALVLITLYLSISIQEALTGEAVSDSTEDALCEIRIIPGIGIIQADNCELSMNGEGYITYFDATDLVGSMLEGKYMAVPMRMTCFSASITKRDETFFDGLQANYRQGFVGMITTFQNLNSTLAAIATQMKIMDQKITASTKGMEQMESKIEASTKILEQMGSKITTQMEIMDQKITASANRMEPMDSLIAALSMELKDLKKQSFENSKNFEKAELYELSDFYGKVLKIDNKDGRNCFNADYDNRKKGGYNFNDLISSVKVYGNCVRLYEHRGCTGRTLELSPGSREDCKKDLGYCGWNGITSSVSFCSYQPSDRIWTASRGGFCEDECDTRGQDYFWCHLRDGSWDYCSPRSGQDHYGELCDGVCSFNGLSYKWCYLTGQRHLPPTGRDWGYCS